LLELRTKALRCGNGFERRLVERTVAMLDEN
jgi:hypothetical protein